MKRHVILVGLSGAGKSTVGAALAAELKTAFADLDRVIEARTGRSVTEIFRLEGEAAFRAREREAMDARLAEPPHVIAAGGGWIAEDGNLERVGGRGLIVHLYCRPETAAARLADARDRPLLTGAPRERLRDLWDARAAAYGRAEVTVETDDRSVSEVVAVTAALARKQGGW